MNCCKKYEVHVLDDRIFEPAYYFVDMGTDKKYDIGQKPPEILRMSEDEINRCVSFIIEGNAHTEDFGTYYFHIGEWTGDVVLKMNLTELGKRHEHIKEMEEHAFNAAST